MIKVLDPFPSSYDLWEVTISLRFNSLIYKVIIVPTSFWVVKEIMHSFVPIVLAHFQ